MHAPRTHVARSFHLLAQAARRRRSHSVDDLENVDELERYVGQSQAMLSMLGSSKYLTSRNCQREVAAAASCRLPLVRVHEADPDKHGAPLLEVRRAGRSCTLPLTHTHRHPLVTPPHA